MHPQKHVFSLVNVLLLCAVVIRNGTYSVLQKRYFDNQDLSVKDP